MEIWIFGQFFVILHFLIGGWWGNWEFRLNEKVDCQKASMKACIQRSPTVGPNGFILIIIIQAKYISINK